MQSWRVDFGVINYVNLIVLHMVLGFAFFFIPFFSRIFTIAIFVCGILFIISRQNRNHEALLVAGYLTGAEVLLRSTDGVPVYEFGKYSVMIVIAVGMYFRGFSKNAVPMWVYILLLLPGVILSAFSIGATMETRKMISFVISGPACLGLVALYTYQRRIRYETLQNILLAIGLPIISHTVYIILFAPSVRDVVTGTDSNGETSGGFGPNQVSTVIGLGLFIFVSRAVLQSGSRKLMTLNVAIAAVMAFRGIVTFSRGGVFTAILMIFLLLAGVFVRVKSRARLHLSYVFGGLLLVGSFLWSYSILQTNGLISNRYNNQDAMGRVKESRLSGREEIAKTEIDAFLSNPFIGVGVARTIEARFKETGQNIASHNEITRLLAEHGSLGIAMLLILSLTPIFLHLDNRSNFFMFPLLFFWLLTINHAAMRIAAPAFVYALSLLKVEMGERTQPNKPRSYPGLRRTSQKA